MNQRIEHITKQVDEYFDDLTIEFSREAWQAKFAELIVRECANICYGFGESGDGYTCSAEVLEHFGVEE